MTQSEAPASARAERQPLTRELIIDTAMEIVDREDLDGLTMRRLARELGVAATAVYWHLRTRDEILKGVYDLAVSRVAAQIPDEGSWMDRIKAFSRAVRDMHRAHPFMFSLARRFPGRGAERSMDSFIATAPASGLSAREAIEVAFLFQTFAIGFAFVETSTTASTDGGDATGSELLDEMGPDVSLQLLSLLVIRQSLDTDELFEVGLDALAERLPAMIRGRSDGTDAVDGAR